MFFATPDSVSMDPRRPAGELIAASLTFQGSPPGRFGLVVSSPVARTLAADFIGCEDSSRLLPAQVAGVIEELSNIMCGVVLSELESNANFDLGAPKAIHVAVDEPGPDFTAGSPSICRFEFSQGALVFFLTFEEPA
jgi:chemotaxis protein CheY-P-specific phosphatase CheC